MARNLAGCRILVTGASSGIGRALAESAAQRGAKVALAARSADRLEEIAGTLRSRGLEALVVPGDVTSGADRERMVATVVDRFGGLDLLINNAGVGSFGHFLGSTEAVLRQIMEVNFFAPVELFRIALPHLRRGRHPALVNVSSMCGRRGMPAWPEYSASKFALVGMTEALRAEMARFDIDVLLILPGLTQSDYSRNLLRKEGRMKIAFDKGMPPGEVAEAVVRAVERNRSETVLGWDARWMLRAQRFFPWLVNRLLARKVRQLYAGEEKQPACSVSPEESAPTAAAP